MTITANFESADSFGFSCILALEILHDGPLIKMHAHVQKIDDTRRYQETHINRRQGYSRFSHCRNGSIPNYIAYLLHRKHVERYFALLSCHLYVSNMLNNIFTFCHNFKIFGVDLIV